LVTAPVAAPVVADSSPEPGAKATGGKFAFSEQMLNTPVMKKWERAVDDEIARSRRNGAE